MACEREEEHSDSGVNGFAGTFIPDMKISVENMTILFALPWLGVPRSEAMVNRDETEHFQRNVRFCEMD